MGMQPTFDSVGIPNLRAHDRWVLNPAGGLVNRHLRLAGLQAPLHVQLTHQILDVEIPDFAEALKDPTFGVAHPVMCPACEVGGGDEEEGECYLCKGKGMVKRKAYEAWLKGYQNACSHSCGLCKELVCISEDRAGQACWPVLEAWVGDESIGSSLDGWDEHPDGVANPAALHRYLHEVCTWNDIPVDEDEEDDEDEDDFE